MQRPQDQEGAFLSRRAFKLLLSREQTVHAAAVGTATVHGDAARSTTESKSGVLEAAAAATSTEATASTASSVGVASGGGTAAGLRAIAPLPVEVREAARALGLLRPITVDNSPAAPSSRASSPGDAVEDATGLGSEADPAMEEETKADPESN